VSALTATGPTAAWRDRWTLAGAALTATATLLVVAAYLFLAGTLVTYPWDWSPDQGLYLDYGRRVLEDPGSLYPHRAVPFPSAYGPLVPVLLAPLVGLPRPLEAARLLALAGQRLLVSRPDLVYFLAGQEAEIEGTSFLHLAAGGARGADGVLRGLQERRYALVVWTWPLPDSPGWTEALLGNYVRVGDCHLGYYYGALVPSHLALRRGLAVPFEPPPGTRCEAVHLAAPNGARRP